MGTAGTWCRIYDEGDIGAIVREGTVLYSNPFDFDHLFARSDIPVEHNGCEKAVPLSSAKEEPENVCSTASSPRASEYQKYPPRSPKRELDNSSPKEIEIKTEANDQMSPSKICPSPKLPAIKRRKSQQKSIVCIPMVEGSWNKQGGAGVASDLWSWRKYGQKPIKGSPYPRGYYRCSSSKGCPARKQVERSCTDPTMLLITYTADHNHASPAHRRALARSSGHNSFSSHDKKENSFSLQQPLSLSVPDAAIATDHDHDHDHNDLSPPDKSAQHEDHYLPQCVDNSLFDDDQQFLSPNNHIFHDDLFQSFGDFSSLFRSDLTNRSDEEDDCAMVDPFNLFDWSFSTTNEWRNS